MIEIKADRISAVNNIKIQNVVNSSIVHFGDSVIVKPKTNIFALQRLVPIFYQNEVDLRDYSIYYRPIPKSRVNESINFNRVNKSPYIKVDGIYVLSFTTSSIFHVGSTQLINNEARIKNIRHLNSCDYRKYKDLKGEIFSVSEL